MIERRGRPVAVLTGASVTSVEADTVTLSTGQSLSASLVIAAWSQMDDPNKSIVVDKMEFAPTPHAPGLQPGPALGHWLGGTSHNVPDDRKRGAVEFFRWFQTPQAQVASAKMGAIPISGLGMLLWQAAIAEQLWFGLEMPVPYIQDRFFGDH